MPHPLLSHLGNMSITYLALQCVQCSTMQVKQQRKSSNKWACAVCNQRQSVRQVHACGPLAKDLRHFVQTFNMSRILPAPHSPPSPIRSEPDHLSNASDPSKKGTDWSEYFDPQEIGDQDDDDEDGDLFGSKMPTVRLPPKRATTGLPSKKVEFPKCPSTAAPTVLSRKREEIEVGRGWARPAAKKLQRTAMGSVGSSRWSQYLDEDVEEGLDLEGSSPPAEGIWNGAAGRHSELQVEEEVHPDFM